MAPVTVHELYVYPVKSLAGSRLEAVEVEFRGLRNDRRWMVVDRQGEFMSQRSHPKMALARATVGDEGLSIAHSGGSLSVSGVASPPARPIPVRVWGDEVAALDEGDEIATFLSDFLGVSCRLVRMPETTRRPADPRYGSPGDHVSFADGFPLLVLSRASLEAVAERLGYAVEVLRFRPNLVVAGCPPFEEDRWRRLTLEGVSLRLVKPCARCALVNVDPSNAVVGKEPLATLASFRTAGAEAGAGPPKKRVLFGQNAAPDGLGTLRVGARGHWSEPGLRPV